MSKKSFRDLDAWKKAIDLTTSIYVATREFPNDQRYGLSQQMQRAAVSIPSNIAEGHGRKTNGEFAYFVRISRGSVSELETQTLVSKNLGFLDDPSFEVLEVQIETVGKLINGLLTYLENTK